MVATNKKKLRFVRGYEVRGVSPLPHYYEEIYGHTKGIPAIGPRGDKHYFWYSNKLNGAAYYEVSEQKKSAISTYAFLSDPANVAQYFKMMDDIKNEVIVWISKTESLKLKDLSTKELGKYFHETLKLDARIFSLYLISQPYKLQLFEDAVRDELSKRVASSRIDYYLARLTASEEQTQSAQEEKDWILLLKKSHKILSGKNRLSDLSEIPEIDEKVVKHYEKYKILGLGDGNWTFDTEKERKRFVDDFNSPLEPFLDRLNSIKNFTPEILAERNKLEKELYLDKKTVEIINFLARMSHSRYSLRVEGFVPVIYCADQIGTAYSERLGLEIEGDLPYLTPEELEQTVNQGQLAITQEEINKRRGKKDEYLILLDNQNVSYFYNEKAGEMFKKLVPPVDHSQTKEITGISAEHGLVKDSATVYRWGDDIAETKRLIKKHPILVAGQTRPAMMPVIRLAKGIVTDEGGVTSHAAIVARELKIPTVINTHEATKIFKTGDKLTLDASNGLVKKASQ